MVARTEWGTSVDGIWLYCFQQELTAGQKKVLFLEFSNLFGIDLVRARILFAPLI
jgi:hypothetical protein